MNHEWLSFLTEQGARLAAGRVTDFGSPDQERQAAAESTVLAELSTLAFIQAEGPDTVAFLQGQLSNDIRQLDHEHSQLSSYSTAKGRMLAICRIFRRADAYLLQLPDTLHEPIHKRLRMFVLRSKVKLEEANDLVAFGVSGSDAGELVEQAIGARPADPNGSLTRGEVTVLVLPGPHPRYQLVARIATARELWTRLKTRARPVCAAVWSWLDIRAGLPTVLPETSEAFVPQMANLELLAGVNFKKGCYPGQEIVARMQYLGRLKQRMYLAHVDVEPAPRPGESAYAPDFGDQAAGTVVDAQPAPRGGHDLLIVAQISSAERGDLRLRNLDGAKLQLLPLPYAIPTTQDSATRQ